MTNNWQSRKDTYLALSTHLAHLDNEQLKALFNDGEKTPSWGTNQTIKLGESKVFVKTIPITETEYQQMFSTKNLYQLPTYYSYGIGSAGFGAFREIVTHIKTTNWVLDGSIENFPLMCHYRIIPATVKSPDTDVEGFKRYVKYWNSNENIEKYMIERQNASYEALLFLEYFPEILEGWLDKNMDKLAQVISQMRTTITFLRQNGIIHFDGHFGNIVTDEERFYLTDFGLVLDEGFDLSASERLFFEEHTDYDYGLFLACIEWPIASLYTSLEDTDKIKIKQKYGVEADLPEEDVFRILVENISEIYADGMLELDRNYVETVIKYRPVMRLMNEFFVEMQKNDKKDTPYPHRELKRLLDETGFLPRAVEIE